MSLRAWVKKYVVSEFERNVFKLVSGAAVAQLIPWLISPLLTRLYTPEKFGLLTILLSILTIGNTINTAKYDVAIYLPKDDQKAWTVVGLNHRVVIFISLGIAIIFLLFGSKIKPLLDAHDLGIWFYLSPVAIFFMGFYKVLYSWLNRMKRFTQMAVSRVVRSVSMSATQVFLGISTFKSTGLLVGQFVGEISAALYLFWTCRKTTPKGVIQKTELNSVAKEYSGFPKYSLPGDFINAVSNQVPVFLFSSFFGTAVVGQYGLTYRILTAPLSLISGALLDVFRQKASEDYARDGSCRPIFLKTLIKLVLFSLPIFLVIGIFGPSLFSIVFGKEWTDAGRYASILSILFFVRFVASPLSYVLYIAQKQKVDLLWQVVMCLVILSGMSIGIWYESIELTLWLFALSYSFMYLIYLYLSYKYSQKATV